MEPVAQSHPLTQVAASVLTATLIRILEEVDYGMLLLDGDGRLHHANQLGLNELSASGPLELTRGRVQARMAADQSAFSAALHSAARGLRKLVTLGHSTAPLSVSALPMALDGAAREDDEGNGARGAVRTLVLLWLGKRHAGETLSIDFYSRAHGLTAAESDVLKLMWRGIEPKEIARSQGVALCTVRSHICAIRMKTRTSSIRELLTRLAALPPITPAMKLRPVADGLAGC